MSDNGQLLQVASRANAQAAAVQAMFEAEIRATAREIYAGLVVPYLNNAIYNKEPRLDGEIIHPTAKALRELADLAWKSAQYVYVPTGLVKVDDEKTWGK